MATKYIPAPIDTSDVRLNSELQQLVHKLAANVHDVWAAKRLADGWTLGPERHDAKKQHPCLVVYDDLPDSEKAYDTEIVEQTIKAALAMGFKISKD